MKALKFLQLLRPYQWIKNAFIFLPLFFNGQLLNLSLVVACIVGFVAFALAASSIYCFNDIIDAKIDRAHPINKKRPIASGIISVQWAYILMAFCLILSIAIILLFGNETKYAVLELILFYYILNIAYTLVLKKIPIIDVMIISIGFVLRIFVGGMATHIELSEWIIIMTFLLALFLAFAKRRDDVILYENEGVVIRKNANRYNLAFMNQVLSVIAAVTIIAYLMYTLSPDIIKQYNSKNVYLTSFFVIAGIIRYLQITIVDLKSENPTKIIYKDLFIQFCIIGWIGSFLLLIYL
ncbi:MAG: UbiA prenyltransferase family protein [Bacteroidales bacterium]|jgi:4-hydroxybenzoate polyprenyltransferase|nr:UbiA prenyltransferase family protein [Bacteroidales bacterium]